MKKLFIDLEICYKCKQRDARCHAKCSYFYHRSNILKIPIENVGVEQLLLKIAQILVCRRCEEKFCVKACPNEALEKIENNIVVKHQFRCIACKTCMIACPFGTIYPEILSYVTSACDYCLGRVEREPICVTTCPEKALKYIEIEESKEKNIYLIDEKLAVRCFKWSKDAEVIIPK